MNTHTTLLDTGPLVAYLSHNDKFHSWAKSQFQEIAPPLITCQAVISEACFLLRNSINGRSVILKCIHPFS